MMDKLDFGRSFRGPAWALAGVCCVGLLSLGTTNCLPAPASDTAGTGGEESSSGGGSGGNSSSGNPSGGSTDSGGTTNSGGTTSRGGNPNSGGNPSSGGNPNSGGSNNSGGTQNSGGATISPSGGTTVVSSGGVTSAGGVTTVGGGGSTSVGPTGSTVTFASGKAQGAMTGYGWVALGTADTISDPKCGTAAITAAAPCTTSTTWNSATALCITGLVPALGTPPDYTGNWGVSVGVNASTTAGTGLGQSFTSITIAVTGSPSSGLRAIVHRSGDPDATSYCYALTPGAAIPLTSFSTTCYNTATPGTAITAADVPKIDKISVQVSSGTAAITVTNLCITGITFAL